MKPSDLKLIVGLEPLDRSGLVYIAAVYEYLYDEIIELSGNVTPDDDVISMSDVRNAIKNDGLLEDLFEFDMV